MIDLALRTRCRDCGADTTKSGDWYMVKDAVWVLSGLGPEDGVLCIADLGRRLGRNLLYGDFQPTDAKNRQLLGRS
jgi:hypothetical protein